MRSLNIIFEVQVIRGISLSLMNNFYGYDWWATYQDIGKSSITIGGGQIWTQFSLKRGNHQSIFNFPVVLYVEELCIFQIYTWRAVVYFSATRSFFSALHLSLPAPPFFEMVVNIVPLFHEKVKMLLFLVSLNVPLPKSVTTKLSVF